MARRFRSLDNLLNAKQDDLEAIFEIGRVMADSIIDFFKQEATLRLVRKLIEAGVNLKEQTTPEAKTNVTGKTFCFTGELKNFSRSEAKRLVREYGGDVSSSVSLKTDFVVSGENSGSKFELAKKIGVKIIEEETFKEMIK